MPDTTTPTRFQFGLNWQDFLRTVDGARIEAAARSLDALLDGEDLRGQSFLDIGCGSGLVSLVARMAGARVTSFDPDEACVRCTESLRTRWCASESGADNATQTTGSQPTNDWRIAQGSILDVDFVTSLGQFGIVYAWGVLHHTGQMRRAIELARERTAPGGLFVLAIYHDQGGASRRWAAIKRFYHILPSFLRPVYVAAIACWYEVRFATARLLSGRNPLPVQDWQAKRRDRGMSVWHDWVDWIGGWPFEVSSPDEIINPLVQAGFSLRRIKTVGNGWGCNEYVFRRSG
jgi:2-polyprenyl-6-hydroxyphenyl methylase/3-demethylubiquinone-9 3-methyltransferase